ncbi:toll/interleukin-1 receptor domain-containing protein [Yoonia sp. SS1-5]|uniref:Toll/interleukin-1 receptor domain-containing protein n=1 Tax=Yoonia rhodophyticola TaxID=3137370 RepID=A0AAN0NLY3_9RHOB
MSEIDVFISYKREEQGLAETVSRCLTDLGYTTVTDLNIQKAVDFGDAIDAMIRQAKLVVVLWTAASVTSRWVRKEAEEAERQGKYFGLRIGKLRPGTLPLAVRGNNWLDLSDGPVTDQLADIQAEIYRIIGPPRLAKPAAEVQSQLVEGDLEFYQVADKIGLAEAYEKYVEVYPDGVFVDAATKQAKGLRRWYAPVRRLPVLALTVALGTAAAGYASFQSMPSDIRPDPGTDERLQVTQSQLSAAYQELEALRIRLREALATPPAETAAGRRGRACIPAAADHTLRGRI